jgi:Domain of unknown function (DUF1772)
MQAPQAIVGFLFGLLAWWQTQHRLWLIGALVLIANWPYTLAGITPTRFMTLEPLAAGPASRRLIQHWAALHAVRTLLGLAATLIFLWAPLL